MICKADLRQIDDLGGFITALWGNQHWHSERDFHEDSRKHTKRTYIEIASHLAVSSISFPETH